MNDWTTTTRYYAFSRYLRETFGCKVQKIPVTAGFTCPNRDGAVGTRGCTFCANESFSPAAAQHGESIRGQVLRGMESSRASKFIAYFQPFTNTYADLDTLRRRYDEALLPDVIGLAIGTRPDCVADPVLDLIESYTARAQLWLEYGVQSCHDRTLDRIARGHRWCDVVDAVRRTQGRGILICAHIILGLPGESVDDVRVTAERIAELGIDGVKLHHLAVVKGTPLEAEYRAGKIDTLSVEQYVALAADVLERLPGRVVVQRLVGDTRGDWLVAPKWPVAKGQVLSAITCELARRNTHQGSLS